MIYYRIQNGIAVEQIDCASDPNGVLYHPSLIWVPGNVGQLGYSYDPVTKILSSPQSVPVPLTQQWAQYQQLARSALIESDLTVNRIAEAVSLGLTTWTALDVVAWMNYRRALRSILVQTMPATIPTILPIRPAYPLGT